MRTLAFVNYEMTLSPIAGRAEVKVTSKLLALRLSEIVHFLPATCIVTKTNTRVSDIKLINISNKAITVLPPISLAIIGFKKTALK